MVYVIIIPNVSGKLFFFIFSHNLIPRTSPTCFEEKSQSLLLKKKNLTFKEIKGRLSAHNIDAFTN